MAMLVPGSRVTELQEGGNSSITAWDGRGQSLAYIARCQALLKCAIVFVMLYWPSPASRARIMASARPATCSFVKIFDT